MFTTITDAKTYYQNSCRYNMEKPDTFNEEDLILSLWRHTKTVEQAEKILAQFIPD